MFIALTAKLLVWLAPPKIERPRPSYDPALEAVLAKPDERLLADVGLSRREAKGIERYLWNEWRRDRTPWSL